jgi:hypothetical protein
MHKQNIKFTGTIDCHRVKTVRLPLQVPYLIGNKKEPIDYQMNGSPEHLAAGFSGAFRPTQSKRL